MKKLIISIDPGKTNLAWVIITTKGKIKYKGLIKETFISLAKTTIGKRKEKITIEANEHVKKGIRIIKKLVKKFNTKTQGIETHLVYERFIPRGRFNKGNLTEIINMVIGQIISTTKNNYCQPLMAATWKKRAKEHYGYTENFNKTLPQHIVDAYSIGLYYLEQNKYITNIKAKKLLKKMKETDYGENRKGKM